MDIKCNYRQEEISPELKFTHYVLVKRYLVTLKLLSQLKLKDDFVRVLVQSLKQCYYFCTYSEPVNADT